MPTSWDKLDEAAVVGPERRKYAWMPYRHEWMDYVIHPEDSDEEKLRKLAGRVLREPLHWYSSNAKVERHSLAKAVLDLLDAE
jgi:hypothetical protein